MIALADYWMGRDVSHATELTDEIRHNAELTLTRVSAFVAAFAVDRERTGAPPLPIVVTSGWRPAAINAATRGAAKRSNHMRGLAIDLADPHGWLKGFAIAAECSALLAHQLWMEHPSATPTWCHLQIVPPASGRRVFFPFPSAAKVRTT